MIYASKTPRDLNHDPEPWHVSLTPSRGANGRWREWRGEATDWDDALVLAEEANPGWTAHTGGMLPRPEFDHVQYNEPNPILVACRAEPGRVWAFLHSTVGGNLCRYPGVTTSQMTHARRVLTRLSSLRGAS